MIPLLLALLVIFFGIGLRVKEYNAAARALLVGTVAALPAVFYLIW